MKNQMENQTIRNTRTLLLGAFAAFALMGCGQHLTADGTEANEMGANYYQNDSAAGFLCSTFPNVLPADDAAMDGTQRYFACRHEQSPTKILVRGYSSSDRYVCAFPVQYLDEERFVYKLDQFGGPLSTCYDASANNHSVEINFALTNYNGVILVDKDLRGQMASCLVAGRNCPTHSIGRFR